MARVLALVDGEHYPPVVRAALQRAALDDEVVGAFLLGGSEKLDGVPDYGVPLESGGDGSPRAVLDAARRLGAERLLDLSDEPVLGEERRIALACEALAAGVEYAAPDLQLRPPKRHALEVPTLAVIGTGKRIGKTSVSGHVARLLADAGRDVVVVAMGRGGPAEPELVEGSGAPGVAELLARADAGQHAASDFLEDAALARVTTVGARRCGGGVLGVPYLSNVERAAELAAAQRPDLVVLEGSGACLPPVAADAVILVHAADRGSPSAGFNRYRLALSDLVVLTMCDHARLDAAELARLRRERPVIETVLEPHPMQPVAGRRVALFTTAAEPRALAERIEQAHGADVVAVSGALSDRVALRADLERPDVAAADTYLVEIKAAGIDVVARAGVDRGRDVVFCDNRPAPMEAGALDAAIHELAAEAVRAGG